VLIYPPAISAHLADKLNFVDSNATLEVKVTFEIPEVPHTCEYDERRRLIKAMLRSQLSSAKTRLNSHPDCFVVSTSWRERQLICRLPALYVSHVAEYDGVAAVELVDPLPPDERQIVVGGAAEFNLIYRGRPTG
jgi:hypothetical protein